MFGLVVELVAVGVEDPQAGGEGHGAVAFGLVAADRHRHEDLLSDAHLLQQPVHSPAGVGLGGRPAADGLVGLGGQHVGLEVVVELRGGGLGERLGVGAVGVAARAATAGHQGGGHQGHGQGARWCHPSSGPSVAGRSRCWASMHIPPGAPAGDAAALLLAAKPRPG